MRAPKCAAEFLLDVAHPRAASQRNAWDLCAFETARCLQTRASIMSEPNDAGAARSTWRVLLVEDDPDLRELLSAELTREGWEVIEASDGYELRALVQRMGQGTLPLVDLVISDVRLPGPSALMEVDRLRQQHPIPWLVMTAFPEEEMRQNVQRLGAAAVFDKPFEVSDLCHVAKRVVEKSARVGVSG
jgi:CheY-like chemotaxis protein